MVIGSSGPSPLISCTSAVPMEVTRSVACISSVLVSACGKIVRWPSQEPARLFRLSKDLCASDFGPSVWEEATTESDQNNEQHGTKRFHVDSPVRRLNRRGAVNAKVIRKWLQAVVRGHIRVTACP